MCTQRGFVAVLGGAALVAAMTCAAHAQQRRGPSPADYGYVTAESRYSGAVVTAPVRYGSHRRLEVRLPGGTWIECGRSCRDTLRRETVDFWKDRGYPGAGGDGPGYFSFGFRY
jgi:hypothetical protein